MFFVTSLVAQPIATVGEYDSDAELVVGVPDGMGAILLDDNTVRVIVQSESYGPVVRYESYPWFVNGKKASFTGSHIQYVDYDRTMLAAFQDEGAPATAESMVKGSGELVKRAYNLKGELVQARNTTVEADGTVGATKVGGEDGSDTLHAIVFLYISLPSLNHGTNSPPSFQIQTFLRFALFIAAHFSNTDKDGNWATGTYHSHGVVLPTFADWNMMSLCSAHLEEKFQWGSGIGVQDDLYMTNEEWMRLPSDQDSYVGLAAHAVDIENQAMYALGVFTQGGFEKIVEFSTEHADYVAFSPSGYNGNFGATKSLFEAKRKTEYGTRDDGSDYVYPQDIVPARVYIGKKGYDESGNVCHDFLCRNGLRYGMLYGFASDVTAADWDWRDTWHQKHYHGDTMAGRFYPLKSWSWDGTVKNFEHDGSWEFQDYPKGEDGTTYQFWTALGPDTAGKKTEHNAPAFNSNLPSAFIQTSTAGYFGEYSINGAAGIAGIINALAGGVDFPAYMDAEYYLYQGETDVDGMIDLGGKGIRADYNDQSAMTDSSKTHTTFEDIDGFETIQASEGVYAVIQEDGGNVYGERMFITKLHKDTTKPLEYKFIAMSGGNLNTRMMAGVGVPAGVNVAAGNHEFSGVIDLTGLLAKNSDGTFKVSKTGSTGVTKHTAAAAESINDHQLVLGLQAHNMISGVIQYFAADRGGQWLSYRPKLDTA